MRDTMGKPVLKVISVSKRFFNINAVVDLSFVVNQGDIFAFLGPNGAGKTTTLRILLDIIKPDDGQIEWNLNGNIEQRPSAGQIGYLPEERGLYLDIPVIKSLVYLASIRGMDKGEAKKSALEWLERLELGDRANEKLQALSKGNQQKIQFIASILHRPAFAILDEPFSGLDPLNQEMFIEFIKEINQRGTTILLSAHQMTLVEKIAQKVFLIDKGEELYNGNLSDIYNAFGKKKIIELHFQSPVDEGVLKSLNGAETVERIDDLRARITFGQHYGMKDVLNDLAALDGVGDISSIKPDLHDIFLHMVKKQ
jgi:ABC-2 type transport system ATP-binding protein